LAYKILRSPAIKRDLDLVFEHLLQSYIALGDDVLEAFERANHRIEDIKIEMNALALAPYQGTLDVDMRPGLRHVTKGRAIFYFFVDEASKTVHVLAVFFGGQDHQQYMLARLS
jgi:plasmid stabilization system protein ParE